MLDEFKIFFFFFETNSYSIALAGLELNMQTRVTLKSQKPVCLCLQVLGLKRHPWMISTFKTCMLKAGEMDQRLRVLALPENGGPVPSTHVAAHNYLTLVPGDLMSCSGL